MSFVDLDEFFDDTLKLPVGGKLYTIASVDAETGLWCQRMLSTAAVVAGGAQVDESDVGDLLLDDDQERDLYRRVLGTTYDELVTDGVSWERLKHVGTTAFMWAAGNKETAEDFWVTGGGSKLGEPQRPVPQDHKAPAKKKAPRVSRAGSTPPVTVAQ
jgi:hypothetical protein